jgi:hypothetical protein
MSTVIATARTGKRGRPRTIRFKLMGPGSFESVDGRFAVLTPGERGRPTALILVDQFDPDEDTRETMVSSFDEAAGYIATLA